MKTGVAILMTVVTAAVPMLASSDAYAQSCGQLWYQRNSIYKAAGYCFKTPRAIRTFGNAGCAYDSEYSLPLSYNQRARINRIVQLERDLGPPDSAFRRDALGC
jgi:hypothetical protein